MGGKIDVELRRDEVVVEVKAMQDSKEYKVVEIRFNLVDVGKSLLSMLTQKLPGWIGIKTNEKLVKL